MAELAKARPQGVALLWEIFWTFLKIGSFTIGGGYAMVPVIERVLAQEKGYLTQEEFLDRLVIAQTAPGVLATNISVAVGYRLAGVAGAGVAALGTSLPGFVIIILILTMLREFQDSHLVKAFFAGAEPVVVVLLVLAAWSMGKNALHRPLAWVFGIVTLVAVLFWGVNPIFAIIAGAGLGLLLFRE